MNEDMIEELQAHLLDQYNNGRISRAQLNAESRILNSGGNFLRTAEPVKNNRDDLDKMMDIIHPKKNTIEYGKPHDLSRLEDVE